MCAADPVLRVTLLVLGKSVPVIALEAVCWCGGQGASITSGVRSGIVLASEIAGYKAPWRTQTREAVSQV